MIENNREAPEALKNIEEAFANWRQGNHKGRVPVSIKRLAIAAVDGGHSASAVARAAGVSKQSMSTWRKSKSIAAPTELKISGCEPVAKVKGEPVLLRICFRSGASVEIPASLFTARLVAALNGGAA
jgi:hypothetical protein